MSTWVSGATHPGPSGGALEAGSRLRQYELIREIGRGGMGQVFLARDTKLGRRVAIKVLDGGTSADFVQRFLMEARTTAQCTHENIVIIHEADEHLGQPYLVLEYLEGATLREHLQQRRVPFGRAVELMVPVVRALVRAHEGQIVHRDLKPENVFVTTSGTVKVLDFGLAKLSTPTADAAAVAGRTDGITGTPPYMAPEQFWEPDVDERADLYAVGVMFFEMLTGRHPIQPLTLHTLMAAAALVDEPLPSVGSVMADLPRHLEQLVDRCLSKRREGRHPSAQALLDDLLPLLPRGHGRQLDRDESPFPGLAAFQESDADRFFGRAPDVRRLLALLDRQPLVAVVGPSGVGKSSLVQAGLVPALKASGEAWEVLFLRPGRMPLGSLASVLFRWESGNTAVLDDRGRSELVARLRREPGYFGAMLRERAAQRGTKILLAFDQLEELFTQVPDAEERAAFTASITGAADDGAGPIRILVSMRSDFLDRLGEDPRLLEEVTRGLQFLGPLGKEGLKEALTQPIVLRGHSFEDDRMVDELIGALATTSGALPLMQFVAERLWESRDPVRKVLTRQSFAEMGGVAGALAAHAEQVVLALSPAASRLVRVVLPRLVTPESTRRVVDLEELDGLGPAGAARALVEELVRARLLVLHERSDGPAAVELVHESLIGGWPTLRRCVEEGREDAAFVAQLRAAAKQWAERGRVAGLLWQGETAEEARLWRGRSHAELPAREQDFLDAVLAQAARAGRVRRIVIGSLLSLLLLTIAVGGVALVSVRRAERAAVGEAERAQHETQRARAAEQKIKDQLALIAAEQTAKAAALGQVQRGKEDLRETNSQLKSALARAEEESRRAKDSALRAGELAESLRKTNSELQKNYAREKARNDELSRERKKISTDLR